MSWYWWILIIFAVQGITWIVAWAWATVQGIMIHRTWMNNSWALLSERMWWVKATNMGKTLTPEEFNNHLVKTLQDYNDIFGRAYEKEVALPAPTESTHERPDP